MSLRGLKVVEMAGLAPGPFCGMVLADHGASVIKIDKTQGLAADSLSRGKRSLAVNLKKSEGVSIVRRLCRNADVLIEPFRPGIMEKLGLGPQVLCTDNPGLIYARLTGFGQSGPYKDMAGHDINYIATSGVLSRLGRSGSNPHAPINLLADFAGGGLICAMGIVMALLERTSSRRGQIIDANMVQGSAYVSSFLWSSQKGVYGTGLWSNPRGENPLDGGAPFYDTYKTKDGKYMAVGALEPQFFGKLLQILDLSEDQYSQFGDTDSLREALTQKFLSKTQSEWTEIFDGTDACVTPVVDLESAHKHPHNHQAFVHDKESDIYQPSPAPGLSRTPGAVTGTRAILPGENSVEILSELGLSTQEINNMIEGGIVMHHTQSKL